MGKKLIVKGADFSENAIQRNYTWFVNECARFVASATNAATRANGGWSLGNGSTSSLQGHTFNVIRFKPSHSGALHIYSAASRSDLTSAMTLLVTINVQAGDVGSVMQYEFNPVTLAANAYIVFGEANSEAGMYYAKNTSGVGFFTKVGSGTSSSVSNQSLCFDIGYVSD